MGGMCARVCPTEVLCEQACVRNTHEDQPVRIGLLQRYATDPVFEDEHAAVRARAARPARKVAVVGGGPAGLSCAHRLAMLGPRRHGVRAEGQARRPQRIRHRGVQDARRFRAREVEYILGIGGIEVRTGVALGKDVSLADLRANYDAVFLGFGLAGVNGLGLDGEQLEGVVERRRLHRDAAPGDRQGARCRSAGASS